MRSNSSLMMPPYRASSALESSSAYCNAGYWLTGALVAQRTGHTFEEALRQRVLEPLGLERTSFDDTSVVPRHLTDPQSGEVSVAAPLRYSRRGDRPEASAPASAT